MAIYEMSYRIEGPDGTYAIEGRVRLRETSLRIAYERADKMVQRIKCGGVGGIIKVEEIQD